MPSAEAQLKASLYWAMAGRLVSRPNFIEWRFSRRRTVLAKVLGSQSDSTAPKLVSFDWGTVPQEGQMEEFFKVAGAYIPDSSRLKGLAFKPAATDIIITTAAKSGTTWMQQICHGLRSRGSMDFEEISQAVPFLEIADIDGYGDLQKPQQYQPRMFKTHFWRPCCPKGAGKYIVLVRRPSDVALSSYRFFDGWYFPRGKVALDEFVEGFCLKAGAPKSDLQKASQLHHILSWYPYRFDENVLWLHYEDLQDNLSASVRLIAEFLDIGREDTALQELVTKQASFEFMKQRGTQFDLLALKRARNVPSGLPSDAGMDGQNTRVREGAVHASKQAMPEHLHSLIEQRWKEVMTPDTGYHSYEQMREGINAELGRTFK